MTSSDERIYEKAEISADWIDSDGLALTVNGEDLVHISDIDHETGVGRLTVFASVDERAEVLWTGDVRILPQQ